MRIFARLTKIDVEKREVWGRAVQEVPDKAKEIFDYETSVPHFKEWSGTFAKATENLAEPSLGNIRAMHGKVAAGKAIAIEFNDADKAIDIGTKIVDDNEWQKCVEGVYTGFSIGGDYLKKWKDAANQALTRYTAKPSEISLVDNPCVGTAVFSVVKSATETDEKPFQKYGLLKAVIDREDLTVGELLSLTKEYLPEASVEGLAKADAPLSEFREQLRALVADTPVAAAEKTVESTTPASPATGASEPAAEKTASTEEKKVDAPAEKADGTAPTTQKVLKHLRKGIYSVQTFAGILQSLAWLAQDAEAESKWEGDASTVPADLRTAIQLLCEIFKRMTAEETDELIASIVPEGTIIEVIELAAVTGELVKAGKRHSAADMKMIQGIHDHAADLGADCAASKALKSVAGSSLALIDGAHLSELGKAVEIALGRAPTEAGVTDDAIAAMAKTVVSLAGEKEALAKRVKFFEAQPAPGKGVVRTTVTKADDAAEIGKTNEPVKPDPKDPVAVMKAVHAAGGTMVLVKT